MSSGTWDSGGRVKSVDSKGWETLILYGLPYRRMIERDGKPLPPEEQAQRTAKARPVHRQAGARNTRLSGKHRLDEYLKERTKDRELFREIPDLFDFHLDGEAIVDGRPVWVISGAPARRPAEEPRCPRAPQNPRPHVDRQDRVPVGEDRGRDD